MKEKRNKQKGITLIALIITIIVLLILAGVTIATLTGNHGILTQVDNAKIRTIEARVNEEIGLAVQSANLDIITKTAEDNSWNATTDKNIETVVKALTEDLKTEKGYKITDKGLNAEGRIRTLEVAYVGQDYRNAIKNPEATITKTFHINKNEIMGYIQCVHNFVEGICTKCGIEQTGVKSINIANMTLDGASLITATLTNDKIATSADVTWSSSNSNVATVEANGIVKCGTQTGTAEITCTGLDGTTKTCTVTNEASKIVYTNNGTANSTITGSTTDFSYKQPIIPVGYSAIDTIDAQWKLTGVQENYNKGLVIMDEKGNQYVWVPVDGTTVPYQKWCTTYISHVDCSDDTLSDGTTIASVDATTTTYGGFWIGRYEAGLDVDLGSNYQLTTSRNVTGRPIIVEGAIPWNNINYTNSRANAESLVNNTYVRSGLVNGTQWDTALKWVKSNTSLEVGDGGVSTAWGNYNTSSLTLDRYKQISTNYGASWSSPDSGKTTNGSSQILRTGASTETKSLNISDLAGNMWEWTNEICSSHSVRRGGSYYNNDTNYTRASCRTYDSTGDTHYNKRF